jgi:hypothetical protein
MLEVYFVTCELFSGYNGYAALPPWHLNTFKSIINQYEMVQNKH